MRVLIAAALVTLGAMTLPAVADDADKPGWAGPYIGLHAGYGWGRASTHDDMNDWCSPADVACIKKYVGPFDFDVKGAFGGITAGYNFQYGMLVFGPEVEAGYMNVVGNRKTDSSNPAKYQTLEVDGGWYALLGGRIGLGFDHTLIYGKGGWVYWDTDITQTTTNPGYKTNGTGAIDGWAYGGGIEHMLGEGWSLKVEYLHMDFGGNSGDQTSVSDPPIGHVYENHTDLTVDTVKVGINRRF